MMMFVVVLEDRHTDPEISLHRTRRGADARIDQHKAGNDWIEEPVRGWLLYLVTDHEDGPNLRIEEIEVES